MNHSWSLIVWHCLIRDAWCETGGGRDAATQVRSGSFYFIPLNNCRQSGESLHLRNIFQFLWATNEVLSSDILSWALGWSSNVAKEWRGRKISIYNGEIDTGFCLSACLCRGRSRAGGRSPPSTRFSEVMRTFVLFSFIFSFFSPTYASVAAGSSSSRRWVSWVPFEFPGHFWSSCLRWPQPTLILLNSKNLVFVSEHSLCTFLSACDD